MSAGLYACAPDQNVSDTSQYWFEDIAQESGIQFVHEAGASDDYLLPEIMGSGVALFDVENDGDLDLYLIQSGGGVADSVRSSNELYVNDGLGNFTIAVDSGLEDSGYGMGVATGDYDGDGFVDVFVTNVGTNRLFRNLGDGSFLDVTEETGLMGSDFSTASLFGDFDNDNDLDLFVVNYVDWSLATERDCYDYDTGIRNYCDPGNYDAPSTDVLYRNDGNGTFTNVTTQAGIALSRGNGLGAVASDFNDDGLLDIYVANDKTPNHLWINQKNLEFKDEGFLRGAAMDDHGIAKAGMGVVARDVDFDLDVDIIVVNIQGETDSLYRNDGEYFADASASFGLTRFSRNFTRFGVALYDFNHDGRLDFYEANGRVTYAVEAETSDPYAEPNALFEGSVGLPFRFVPPERITREVDIHTSRGVAAGDVNDDGKIDLIISNRNAAPYLLRNATVADGAWLAVDLLTEAGSPALNAQLRLKTDLGDYRAEVQVAGSYLAANSPTVHLTFPTAPVIVDASVSWPDGAEQKVEFIPINRRSAIRRSGDLNSSL